MRDHIITGYDGSELSAAAAAWAAEEALRRGAGLTVVGCYSMPSGTEFGVASGSFLSAASTRLRDSTRARVDELAADLSRSHPGLTVNGCAVPGRPHRRLVEQARQADVVVIGSTGAGHGSFMGSVTRAVARNSPCPVVVVPAARPMAESPRVVVGVDGNVRSAASLEWAIDETDLLRGQLVVVHAFSYPYGDDGHEPSIARDLMRIDAARQLEQAVDRARTRGGSKVDGELAEGRAAAAIVEAARGADLIVVGTRQRSLEVQLTVFGSVAEAVVSHAPCPVAVVREGLFTPPA